MNKVIHKRIMGILIIIFAFAIFTPKDVFAETCEEARSKFEETAFDKYGIIFDYNSDTNNYELSMNTATENSDILRNAGIVNPALKVTKMEITGNNNEKAVVTGSEITSILGKDILRAGGNSKIRFARRAISGVIPRIIEISLEPSNFKDPDLKTACGENANFSMKVSVTVDIGETMSPRKVASYNLTPFESKYEKIDCSNYASKFKDTSFEYSYCKDLASAKAAGAKEYNYDSEHLTYASKYSDKAVFKCDYKVDGPTQSIFLEDGKTPNPNYYKNTKYLIGHGTFEVIAGTYEYHVEVAKGNVEAAKCEVSCDEVVTVEYGAPIAAKAGMCMEYKVRVTSRVNCGLTKEPNKPKEPIICVPTPVCVGKNGAVRTQGGPSEDFDKCIQNCDGGKYTEKCSNKCYKSVYGTSTSISKLGATNGSEISYGTKIQNKYETYNYSNTASENQCIYVQNNYKNNKEIVWITDQNDNRRKNKNGVVIACDSAWHRLNTWGVDHDYQITKNGIPAMAGCTDTCSWKANDSAACKDPNSLVYLNDPTIYEEYHPGKKSQYTIDMEANEKTYNSLKDSCAASVTCNTSTAEFTISVNYTKAGETKEETVNFPYSTKKDTITFKNDNLTQCTVNNNDTTIMKYESSSYKGTDGCYFCGGKATAKNMYQTEWSFPGTWENKKTHEISYNPATANNSNWRKHNYQFCLPFNVGNVNEKWFNYYYAKVYGDDKNISFNNTTNIVCADGTTISDISCDYRNTTYSNQEAKSIKDGGITNYNINAVTRKFGFFEWDINISCFYAVNSEFPKLPGKECNNSCESKDGKAYRVVPVDLDNLFPDSEGNKLTSSDKTGRTVGFNWSQNSIQTEKDENYKSIAPNYATWVQAKGYSVYSDEYLDYEINLSKEMITSLRKVDRNYTNWEGEVNNGSKDEIKSADTYQSKLIRETLAGSSKYPNYQALQCNNIGKHTATANYSAECEDFTGEVK